LTVIPRWTKESMPPAQTRSRTHRENLARESSNRSHAKSVRDHATSSFYADWQYRGVFSIASDYRKAIMIAMIVT
jgi:hypothetical protein